MTANSNGNRHSNGQKATVAALGEAKRLPVEYLRSLGLCDSPRGVEIPYFDAAGNEMFSRLRTALVAKEGSRQPPGVELAAYGSWRIDEARKKGILFVGEGESNGWAMWFHKLPFLGCPGANTTKVILAEHLEAIGEIYILVDPDKAGERFLAGIRERLSVLDFKGKVYALRFNGVKDVADLHVSDPDNFLMLFQRAVAAAMPVTLTTPKQTPTLEQWGELAPLAEVAAEEFPLDVFPLTMRAMAEAIALSMPCPVDMPACAMLAAAATAIGYTRQLRIKSNWFEGPRLRIALVAKPGSKKSPASSAANRPVRAAQRRLRNEYKKAVEQYKADKLAWKDKTAAAKENDEAPPPEPEQPIEHQVFTTDTTRESLAQLLQENKRGLMLIRDELTGWARSLNQYKGRKGDDKQFWLSLWSGETVVVNRREYKVTVDDPFICVSGNIPPDVLGELNDEKGREDGFIHRILFSWPAPVNPGWRECEPHPDTIAAYSDFFESLFRLQGEHDDGGDWRPRTLTFTNAAKQLFGDFVNDIARDLINEDFPDNLRGPWSKMESYCARFALVLQICRITADETDGEDVDEVSVHGAIRLARYFMAHARRVYPRLTSQTDKAHENALAVQNWILRNRDRIESEEDGKLTMTFTWYMIRRDLHTRFEEREEDLQKALALLEGRGFIRESQRERAGNTGRNPKPNYTVNPAIWCG